MLFSLRRGAVALLIAATTAPPLGAQVSQRSVPETFAITGATIVPGTGSTIEHGTVVVRRGLITAVGARVTVPADARTIDGTGLTVYPGFIDAFGSLGIPGAAPAAGGRGGRGAAAFGAPAQSASPLGKDENHPMGITPEVLAVDLMKVQDDTWDGPRSAGITTTVSAPNQGYLTGRVAVVDLSGSSLDDAVLKSPAAMTMQFGRGRGFGGRGYPSSLMGIFAAFRQEVLDAQRYGTWAAMYERNPRGIQRPPMDPGLEAMQPVVRGEQPVVFVANSQREIDRAIGLVKEFKLKGVIAGGAEADRCIPELKAAGIPVILSLDFPRATARGPDAPPDPLRVLEARVEAPRVAGKLAAAGIPVAFESGDISNWSDFLHNAAEAVADGMSAAAAVRALTVTPARIFGLDAQTGSIEPGKIANLTVMHGGAFDANARVDRLFIDGQMIVPEAPRRGGRGGARAAEAMAAKSAEVPNLPDVHPTHPPAVPTLIRNATILTVTKGTIENGDLLMEHGKITAIGKNLTAPAGATVIDATGKYVMPGIIDPHSHSMIDAVNEGTLSVTSMVNMIDVLNPTAPAIYRELAGGVTTINVLHGSANTIGGQTVTVKLKWGFPVDSMIFPGAPPGIKFALGENVTRKNSPVLPGQERRYPYTRMGQEEVLRDAFTRALNYKATWDAYKAAVAKGAKDLVPPRRDLELEPLLQVLAGKRIANVHSYISSEILMMSNLAHESGFHVLFQHGLEAYKVASELAANGDMVSTFEDFWGYKIEAEDAIPYNVPILMRHGVVVTVNSDDDQRATRLNVDAGEEVRYGGLTQDEALRTITYNGAVQLGVQDRTGSLEVGKDADVAIWSSDPLNAEAIVDATFVDGVKEFDRQEDIARRDSLATLRAELEKMPENQPPGPQGRGRNAQPTEGGSR